MQHDFFAGDALINATGVHQSVTGSWFRTALLSNALIMPATC
jgi:hypothetical protein